MNRYERFDGLNRALLHGAGLSCKNARKDEIETSSFGVEVPLVVLHYPFTNGVPDNYEVDYEHGANLDLQLQRLSRKCSPRPGVGYFLNPIGSLERWLALGGELEAKCEEGQVVLQALDCVEDSVLIKKADSFVSAYQSLRQAMTDEFFNTFEDSLWEKAND